MKFSNAILLFTLLIFVTVFAVTKSAQACQPCVLYNLDETIKMADLIVIAQKSENQAELGSNGSADFPDTVRMRVVMSLKGKAPAEEIVVNSFDGICLNGISPDPAKYYVVLLEKYNDIFDAVKHGCGVKALVYENAEVKLPTKSMSLDEFESYVRTR